MHSIKLKVDQNQNLGFDLNQIVEYFEDNGKIIFKGRNTLKVINVGAIEYCIKSYGKPTLANRFIYSFFRKTKAQRSFENAQKLLSLGFNTPAPIAFVNTYTSMGILRRCFYIYQYEKNWHTLNQVLENNDEELKETVVSSFSRFIDRLFDKDVLNNDFNIGNILVKIEDGIVNFSLIDINRIKFNVKITGSKALKSIQALKLDIKYWELLSKEFSAQHNLNYVDTFYRIIAFKFIYQECRSSIKKILHFFRDLFK
jgi:hypothetical protein